GDPTPEISYEDLNASDKGWLSYIGDYGICLIKGAPTEKRAPAQRTRYGDAFDVVQEYKPSHVAYSHFKLPLHIDYLYQDDAPGLQFLHCLR
ncbi:hypothetical protein ACJMK2_000745, partial [Sinanodonta woodiana]